MKKRTEIKEWKEKKKRIEFRGRVCTVGMYEIYQTRRAREAGFSFLLYPAGWLEEDRHSIVAAS